MDDPAASVVVVSRGRPEPLRLCLLGLSQQFHRPFEMVVVADPAGLAVVADLGWSGHVKTVPFDTPNIAAARNAGAAAAAGSVLCWIDDDSVPEPTWLGASLEKLAQSHAAAVTGHVLGRNGISFQSRDGWIDTWGRTFDRPAAEHAAAPQRVPKLVGTNFAIRRATLAALGGFDERYRFYLEDSDLSLRLGLAGHKVVFAPLAQVHHATSASDVRTADRVPRDLRTIARSQSVFLSTYLENNQMSVAWQQFQSDQEARLIRHMVAGGCTPGDVRRLRRQVRHPAQTSTEPQLPGLPMAPPPVLFGATPAPCRSTWSMDAAPRDPAMVLTLFDLHPGIAYHRVRFTRQGVWRQRGGIWGRSQRDQPLITLQSRHARAEREWRRVDAVRAFPSIGHD